MKFLLWDDNAVRDKLLKVCSGGNAGKSGNDTHAALVHKDWELAQPISASEPPQKLRTEALFVDKSGLLQDESIGSTTLSSSTAPGITFANVQELHAHYKSDYHRYNLKQKINDLPLVSLPEFERRIDEGFSSLSASSSSSETSSSEGSADDESGESTSNGREVGLKRQINSLHPGRRTENLIGVIHLQSKMGVYIFACATRPSDEICASNIPKGNRVEEKRSDGNTSARDLVLNTVFSCQQSSKWVVLLYSAGHFAGAIFENGKSKIHRSIHRYTTRRKQGGSQSRFDQGGKGMAKSAGSQIRRHNEKMMLVEVHDLLSVKWAEEISTCSKIYISCAKRNRSVFFGKNTPGKKGVPALSKLDERIFWVPFATRRPTTTEAERVCKMLGTVHIVDTSSGVENLEIVHEQRREKKLKKPKEKHKKHKKRRNTASFTESSKSEAGLDEGLGNTADFDEIPLTPFQEGQRSQIFAACRACDGEALKLRLEACDTIVVNALARDTEDDGEDAPKVTALHLCSIYGFSKGVSLLIDSGANPAIRDTLHRTSFQIAIDRKDKKVRDAFRLKMGEHLEAQKTKQYADEEIGSTISEPIEIDWNAAGVAMAGALMDGDLDASAERKKAARRRARERKKAAKNAKRAEEQKKLEIERTRQEELKRTEEAASAAKAQTIDIEAQNRIGQVAETVARAVGVGGGAGGVGELLDLVSVLVSGSNGAITVAETLDKMSIMLNEGVTPEAVMNSLLTGEIILPMHNEAEHSNTETKEKKKKKKKRKKKKKKRITDANEDGNVHGVEKSHVQANEDKSTIFLAKPLSRERKRSLFAAAAEARLAAHES